MEDGEHNPMPSQNLGVDHQKNPLVQGDKQELSRLTRSPQEETNQGHLDDDHQPHPRQSSRNWRNETINRMMGNQNPLHLIRRSDGDVLGRRPYLIGHAHWTMVEHSVPKLHLEAGARILPRHLVKNDQNPIVQAHPESAIQPLPHVIRTDEDNCWRLVYGDGGVI